MEAHGSTWRGKEGQDRLAMARIGAVGRGMAGQVSLG